MAAEAQKVTRESFERRFINAKDEYTKWKVFTEVLSYADTLHESLAHATTEKVSSYKKKEFE